MSPRLGRFLQTFSHHGIVMPSGPCLAGYSHIAMYRDVRSARRNGHAIGDIPVNPDADGHETSFVFTLPVQAEWAGRWARIIAGVAAPSLDVLFSRGLPNLEARRR